MGNCLDEKTQQTSLEYGVSKQQMERKKKTLTVATLNYCGIMNSPLEFYCSDFQKQLDQISDIFVSLLPKYIKDFDPATFSWKMGKVDVKFNKGRYSPMFTPKAGIRNGAFISKQEYQKQWQRVFKIETQKIKNFKYSDQQKMAILLYDTIIYHSLLKYVFKVQTIDEAKNKSIKQYLNKIQPFFDLSYLDEQKKLEKLEQGFAKINADIFFIQEYSQFFYDYLQQLKIYLLKVDSSNDVLIIVKKQLFPINEKLLDKQPQIMQIMKKVNLPGTLATMIVGKYIILCSHLHSNKEENKEQINALRKGLIDLQIKLKENFLNYEIILGGDLNSYFAHFSNKYNIFPQYQEDLTTVKKRTMTQCQFNKGRKLVQESKDKIISTLPIIKGGIKYINNENPQKGSLIPNDSHPFDHLAVVAQLRIINQSCL